MNELQKSRKELKKLLLKHRKELKTFFLKQNKKSNLHKLSSNNPFDIIEWINENYPKYKDLCVYDTNEKILKSNKPESVNFHFDPFHNVLNVTVYGT